ncbi:uncharacterized protein F5Z01DRAFT_686325 [Emericellopsis atlantica]|uniref:BZIP domain-containing protein n=1 Tax=Emericellopsis atlantica TaxID=2614577 RepID=A0A9P8CQ97_9HYPO|nr:uncharacterized protein F5Z01DRAFT_686325 [Emericellopsis atlantica]KAG9255087.1 hypothetical protein F5Z01DRAFT_686325 [Emericellopsis atlantica]
MPVNNNNVSSDRQKNASADVNDRTTNPKDAKKEKNRLAQRAYRKRLKAKLESLQKIVSAHHQLIEKSLPPWAINLPPEPSNVSIQESENPTRSTSDNAASGAEVEIETCADSMTCQHENMYDALCPLPEENVTDGHDLFHCPDASMIISQKPQSDLWGSPHAQYGLPEDLELTTDCVPLSVSPNFGLELPTASPRSLDAEVGSKSPSSLHRQLLRVVEQATNVGFTSFDQVVEAYYSGKFEVTCRLHQEQKLSRNRRLPQVLAKIRNASRNWSDWERGGFQEQITQATEEILVDEVAAFTVECPDIFRADDLTGEFEPTHSTRTRVLLRGVQDRVRKGFLTAPHSTYLLLG